MSVLNILKEYARAGSSHALPPTLLLTSSSTSLTIFDKYPKSLFHFLVLPRLPHDELKSSDLTNLQTLLAVGKKAIAKSLLEGLKQDGLVAKSMIEEEMVSQHDYKWDVWMGFHAVPSMNHIHLHVVSADLCSPALKNKKHYNSFHPKLGFFLHVDEVLSWFDAELSFFDSVAALNMRQYESLLKEDLSCWKCGSGFKNIPQLKVHLQEEWDKQTKAEKARLDRKRKRGEKEEKITSEPAAEPNAKRREIEG